MDTKRSCEGDHADASVRAVCLESQPQTREQSDDGFDYLLLSDVHLGSDIVPHVRPWAHGTWLRQEAEVDGQLVALLSHYRKECAPERRWRLIIAGDFLDLVGVSLAPDEGVLRTPPTLEEQRHGLGSAADHVVRKVRAIAERHPRIFQTLQEFVDDGHALVLVRGNHDVELHWREAQRALVDAILAHASDVGRRPVLAQRIQICPWFFHVEGLLYVEHGQEFDAMCSYGDALTPVCSRDPRRIRATPFSVLLRHVARPTVGLSSSSYGYVGMSAYVHLLFRLGVLGSLRITVRYWRACSRLLSEALTQARERGRALSTMSRARMRRFARRSGVSEERLTALRALYVASAVQSLSVIVRNLYLDRIACLLLAPACMLAAVLLARGASATAGLACAALFTLFAGFACIGRGTNTTPKASLRRGAEHIATLFGVRWVVMGHTHDPVMEAMPKGATYVNLGSWGQDDPPDERSAEHACTLTFLTLRRVQARGAPREQRGEGSFRAQLLRWDGVHGAVLASEPG